MFFLKYAIIVRMKYFYIGFVSVIIIYFVLSFGARSDIAREQIFDCVHKKAVAENYAGNPYSPEAYDTFYSFCQ